MLRQFTEFCIKGITANEQRSRFLRAEHGVAGHGAESLHRLCEGGGDCEGVGDDRQVDHRDCALERGDLTEEQIKEILDPARMTEPTSPLEVAKEREKIKGRD